MSHEEPMVWMGAVPLIAPHYKFSKLLKGESWNLQLYLIERRKGDFDQNRVRELNSIRIPALALREVPVCHRCIIYMQSAEELEGPSRSRQQTTKESKQEVIGPHIWCRLVFLIWNAWYQKCFRFCNIICTSWHILEIRIKLSTECFRFTSIFI